MSKKSVKPRRRFLSRRKKRAAVPGSSPGQIVAQPEAPHPVLHLFTYDKNVFVESAVTDLKVLQDLDEDQFHWLNVDGLGDAETIKRLGEIFHLHPLALEDVVAAHEQRPKLEEYPDSLFILVRMLIYKNGHCASVETEQLGMFLLRNTLVTFQAVPGGDPFGPVRERLRKSKGKIRTRGVDYLAYALLDAVIDSYFPLLDERSEEIEQVELEILERPAPAALGRAHTLKQEVVQIRRLVWPLREIVNSMIRDTNDRIGDETKLFLRDCYDHCSQLLEFSETYRELCSDLMNIYLSNISNKMNEIMRFLTIVSTIFIPLTFIAGIYGMNFDTSASPYNMPELTWRYGYPLTLLAMAVVAGGLLAFFHRKGWV